MKRIVITSLLVVMVLGIVAAFADKQNPDGSWKGNECPSGAHFTLNIIGMEKTKRADPDPEFPHDSGHRIFVKLGKKDNAATTKIWLEEGDFAVLDYDGTDGNATFQLPNPDPDNVGMTEYSVYLRLMGKPGGKIKMYTGATDPFGVKVVSDLQVIRVCTKGPRKFSNVSAELLYIYAWVWDPVSGDYTYQRVPLFSDLLEDYLWYYDNSGVRIAQLRFYEGVQTEVPDPQDVPHLSSIVPPSGTQGATLDVKITGANVDLSTTTEVDFGNKITVNTTSASAAQIDVNITIAGDAADGMRYVEVTLNDGRTMTIPFIVLTP